MILLLSNSIQGYSKIIEYIVTLIVVIVGRCFLMVSNKVEKCLWTQFVIFSSLSIFEDDTYSEIIRMLHCRFYTEKCFTAYVRCMIYFSCSAL